MLSSSASSLSLASVVFVENAPLVSLFFSCGASLFFCCEAFRSLALHSPLPVFRHFRRHCDRHPLHYRSISILDSCHSLSLHRHVTMLVLKTKLREQH